MEKSHNQALAVAMNVARRNKKPAGEIPESSAPAMDHEMAASLAEHILAKKMAKGGMVDSENTSFSDMEPAAEWDGFLHDDDGEQPEFLAAGGEVDEKKKRVAKAINMSRMGG